VGIVGVEAGGGVEGSGVEEDDDDDDEDEDDEEGGNEELDEVDELDEEELELEELGLDNERPSGVVDELTELPASTEDEGRGVEEDEAGPPSTPSAPPLPSTRSRASITGIRL